jgi:hypothetical protein
LRPRKLTGDEARPSPFAWWATGIVLLLSVLFGALTFHLSKMYRFPADAGSNVIDVSSYPAEMQRKYKLFVNKCSLCHTLARPINSNFKSAHWNGYVHQMMRKAGSGLNETDARKIIDFLEFDTLQRKPHLQ